MRLLTPSLAVNQTYQFLVAHLSTKYDIRIHSFCAMSNHHHICATDDNGQLPDFFRELHSFMTRCLNRYYKRSGSIWDSRPYNSCLLGIKGESEHCEYGHDLMERGVYCVNNPLRAFRVKDARKWPGANSINFRFGQSYEFERPNWFFREDGDIPPKATLTLTKFPGYEHLSDREMDLHFRAAVWSDAKTVLRDAKRRGIKFAGAEAVLRQNPFYFPPPSAPNWTPIPHVASKDPERRKTLVQRLRTFRAEYRAALLAFIDGDHDVIFPHGTYLMKKRFKVRCHALEPHPPP
ncbi:MAG: transposase [Myxococcales bacterium]|nr:transposase [Myxococcales bacterium]